MSATDFQSRRRAFRELHRGVCFVIPNPWDVGSARYLQSLGRGIALEGRFAFPQAASGAELNYLVRAG